MLEVRNLKKVYKTKNGADVNALDGVTLRFPETGMVFLLGKSGSGKSTLLNVCGGLDMPSDGEIIVKGRSSKDFTQSDFDSYRNTFIGFIFQEYNILNEFSVEDNIAIALELQGKSKDKAAINALLEEVDLQGFAKRKPNTLSGGQKQRIAIARALVKSPEIIMADEPTGALDSNTGRQVLETLKKLSSNKLVIVVSHDRDFAEQYGDRIIELMDGKVISDVSKTQETQQKLSSNVNAVGDVLCVKRGKDLTDADFEQIKAFLKHSDNDVIIAGGERDVDNFKKVSRINSDGSKEVFRDTTEPSEKQYKKEDSRFIRSKLPIKHAIKIGVSSLRTKPFRLCFTILLCTVAFALFGLLSTLNFYNSHSTFVQTMQDADIPVMQLEKDYKTKVTWYSNGEKDYDYESFEPAGFSDSDRKELAEKLGTQAFGAVGVSADFNLRQKDSAYWVNTISAFAVLPEKHSLRGKINGAYPQNKNEIVISSYAADMIVNCKAYDSEGNALDIAVSDAIIGKKIIIGGFTYTVTGIFDSGEIPSEYDALKDSTEPNEALAMQYSSFLGDGMHLIAFVTEDRLQTIYKENKMYTDGIENYTYVTAALGSASSYEFPDWSNANYVRTSLLDPDKKVIYVSEEKTKLSDKEAIISSKVLANMVTELYNKMAEQMIDNPSLYDSYMSTIDLAYQVQQGGAYKKNAETGKEELVPFTESELESKVSQLVTAVKNKHHNMIIGIKLFDQNNNTAFGDVGEQLVVGVYVDTEINHNGSIVVSDNTFDILWNEQKTTVDYYSQVESNYKQSKDAIYSKLYLPFKYSENTINTYWDIYSNDEWEEDESRIRLTGNFVNNLQMVDEMVEQLSKVFLYIGLVLAAFAILLFSNFISASISQKQREIGILRAVGARSIDVFKIFFSESFAIAIICVVLSTVASSIICGFINTTLAAEIGASLFVFGIGSFAVLIAAALVTVVIATFLPVYNAAKKKPVDSIRAL